MKTYEEIHDILTKQLGITDLKSYDKWSRQFFWTGKGPMAKPRRPTKEDIDLLSPDLIDNNAFWRIAEKLFKTDPVANCMGVNPMDIAEANQNNLQIYREYGFTSLLDLLKHQWSPSQIPLLEIGPGYGGFKEWVGELGGFDYYAADVYPRILGVDSTGPDGLLLPVTTDRRYAVAMSCNVFQHLSVAQRRQYYRSVYNCLMKGGFFMVSMMLDRGNDKDSPHRCEDGHWWCRHYGQLTQVQTQEDILGDLESRFSIRHYQISRTSSSIVVCCEKTS